MEEPNKPRAARQNGKGWAAGRPRATTRLIACALLIASLFLTGIPTATAVEGARSGSRVVGYLPTWSYQAYETLDFSALTHLNIAFCNPDASGNMAHGLPSDRILRAIVQKAHENGVYVLASLGGALDVHVDAVQAELLYKGE